MAKTRLDLRAYWNTVGTDNIEKIIARCESTMGYFKLLKCGSRKPSGTLARRIRDAAQKVTPGFVPDLELLIEGVTPTGRTSPRTPPSPEFLRAQARREKRRAMAA